MKDQSIVGNLRTQDSTTQKMANIHTSRGIRTDDPVFERPIYRVVMGPVVLKCYRFVFHFILGLKFYYINHILNGVTLHTGSSRNPV
jgi:hypothetical protein